MFTEDYYVANKLGKGFIGTNNVDTNSRICMASAVVAYTMFGDTLGLTLTYYIAAVLAFIAIPFAMILNRTMKERSV